MDSSIRSRLVTAAAVAAAAAGGVGIANAASNSGTSTTGSGSSSSQQAPDGYGPGGGRHDGDGRGPGGGGPDGGRHTVDGKTEQALTGDTAAKVKAAATAKVKGTVERVETNVDGSAPYEAHIRKADGTEVEVQVSKDFTVAAVNEMDGPGR